MFTLDSTYSLKRRGLLSKDNNDILYNLYLPLVGYKALFIYIFLVNEYFCNFKEGKISDLLKKSVMSVSDFLLNKKSLESIGLMQTLENDNNYVLVLKSVLNPGDFFADPVLKGLFVNKVGHDIALNIMKNYEIDDVDFKNYVDISAGVKDSFSIDFNEDDVQLNDNCELVTVNKNIMKDNFDDIKLVELITTKSNINPKELSIEDINEIHRLGTLYNLSENIMAKIVIDAYDASSKGTSKINFGFCDNRCKKEIIKYKSYKAIKEKSYINSNKPIANKMNYYESTSPREFLKNKQNGVEPISSDLDIISFLSENMGLNNGAINVVLEYCLQRLNDNLNRSYIEKIASTLKRKNLNGALQVYDYLFSKEKNNKNISENSKKSNTIKRDEVSKDIDIDDDDIEKLF